MKTLAALFLMLLATGMPAQAEARSSAMVASCPAGEVPRGEVLTGMFTVRVVCDRVMIEIPVALLDRDMLCNTEFAALSAGSDFVAPGSAVGSKVVRWVRRGGRVYLEQVRYEMWAHNMPSLQRGVESASLRTVIRAFEIIEEGRDGAPVIEVSGLFVADVPDGFAREFMQHFRMDRIDPKRSFLETVKVFPESINIRYRQTWVPAAEELKKSVDDEEDRVPASLGFVFHTSMLLLPEQPMRGRLADERVGYFSMPFDDYGTEEHGRVRRAFIQRYRLEKQDPEAQVSDPRKPIVFYLTPEVPEKWRPYIRRGIEDWQAVFAKAGFSNAILARDAPTAAEDPDWDPEDVRYNVIRWTPSGRQNAMGPAVVDPRSGEVISSHAIFWHDVLRLAETWYFTQASPLDPRAQTLPLPDDVVGDMVRYIVSHEIGHALGLRHNFKAHAAYSVDQLRSREWTSQWGNAASIMAYARLNYVAQPGDDAWLLPRFGPYDYFAIDWGYREFSRSTGCDDDWPMLDAMAALQILDPMLRFGGEDAAAALDPMVNTNVVGSDPVAAADLGLRNVDRVVPLLIPGTTRLGGDYSRLDEMYQALILQRHRQLAAVVKLVGGVEETRYQAGRGQAPFKPVPADRQRQALRFLLDRGMTTPQALLDREVLQRIAPAGGADALQGSSVRLLRQLLDPGVFQRMADASTTAGAYVGLDLMEDLNEGLFAELDAPQPRIDPYRRELQRNYVTLLLVASGSIGEPNGDAAAIDARLVEAHVLPGDRAVAAASRRGISPLAYVAREYRRERGSPSEFRAALRAGVTGLYDRIGESTKRVRDPETLAHLNDLRSDLRRVP